jgi:hypothetical protein
MFYLVIYWTQMVTMTSIFYVVSYCRLSATHQTISITVESYKTFELWLEFLSHF